MSNDNREAENNTFKARPLPQQQSESDYQSRKGLRIRESSGEHREAVAAKTLDANHTHFNLIPTQPSTAPSSSESFRGAYSGESIDFVDQTSANENLGECVTVVMEPEKHKLPPLEEIVPINDGFFDRYNYALPLFHRSKFMRMLSSWYVPSSEPSAAAWAAVKIAIALGHRFTFKEQGDSDAGDHRVQY
ncbi:fungal specific transcription factor [Colletotrichum salicis]|uniref:Fungal specific transcription factor n=1 Tax=Colletotrichum salicis TaxID=1209931 RepID=A0A135UKS2_9PEZI|nr:fungal specific transcription factor [Colletotrichum salicis]